jgi:hypothetical protein
MLRAFLATLAMVFVLGGLAGPPALARDDVARAPSAAAEAFAQERPSRARTRIRVTPRCPYRVETSEFPPPSECDFPGPGFVRQCQARLIPEYRPSGTVIVPRMRCWWERG